ncbi:MAG: hypothetical protein AB2693_16080 [Candidatus Thiodiazotropha sp.]
MSKYFIVVDPSNLLDDLKDPFIIHALTNVCCELYQKYEKCLVPMPAMRTTVKSIKKKKKKNSIENLAKKIRMKKQETQEMSEEPQTEKNIDPTD